MKLLDQRRRCTIGVLAKLDAMKWPVGFVRARGRDEDCTVVCIMVVKS